MGPILKVFSYDTASAAFRVNNCLRFKASAARNTDDDTGCCRAPPRGAACWFASPLDAGQSHLKTSDCRAGLSLPLAGSGQSHMQLRERCGCLTSPRPFAGMRRAELALGARNSRAARISGEGRGTALQIVTIHPVVCLPTRQPLNRNRCTAWPLTRRLRFATSPTSPRKGRGEVRKPRRSHNFICDWPAARGRDTTSASFQIARTSLNFVIYDSPAC